MKNIKKYQGFHTHPSQDSSSLLLKDGTVLVKHYIHKREGLIITQLGLAGGLTTADLRDRLNEVFPNGGYNNNHIKHACDRLRQDGILELIGHTWLLAPRGKARFAALKVNVRKFKGGK